MNRGGSRVKPYMQLGLVYSIATWALYIPHRMFGKVNFHVIHVGKPGVLLQSIHPMHSKPWIGVLDSPL